MITTYLPNPSPQSFTEGSCVSLVANVVELQKAPPKNDYCYCAVECEYIEHVFSDLADGSDYKNDTSSFLFDRVTSTGNIGFELWREGVKIADIVDNTYGVLYDGFAVKPFYKGIVLDWRLISQGLGYGEYQFKAVVSVVGLPYTFESRMFRLLPYSDEGADKTVKIVSYQDGNIVGSNFDYTGLLRGGWVSAYRVPGLFGLKEYELEVDEYQDSRYTQKQIRDQINRLYTLETRLLPSAVSNWLMEDASLSNYLEITDYNVFNTEIFRDVQVRLQAPEEAQNYLQARRSKYILKFEDYTTNLIKRNF
jgi:hypothetical protein